MRAILGSIGTALVVIVSLVGHGPADAAEKCRDRVLREGEGGPNADLELSDTCEVSPGRHELHNVSILQGGSLVFRDAKTELTVHSIVIDNGGSLIAGATDAPIGKNRGELTITFVDSRTAACDSTWCGKGILVKEGGTLRLAGAKGVTDSGVSWTHLSKPAGPPAAYGAGTGTKVEVAADGDAVLQLAKDVTQGSGAWGNGDWIAVATTSFSPFETEFMQISGTPMPNGSGGTAVKLRPTDKLRPADKLVYLEYYHFGGNDPGSPSAGNFTGAQSTKDFNFGVDERAEVGLISRSIKLTSKIDVRTDMGRFWGGEIRVLAKFKEVVLQGVELEKFGKARAGSYPIGRWRPR
jgi:hypothetical protein